MGKLIVFLLIVPTLAYSQVSKKLDLDDMIIKGELHNDDRLLILSRARNEMKNFVKFRQNFREEIIQQLPEKSVKTRY